MSMLFCFGQEEVDSTQQKSNPIIYADFMIGGASTANGEVNGLTFDFDVNYQINKDLLTFRSTYIAERNNDVGLAAIFIFPSFLGGDSMNEYALLYGKRFIFNGSAISVSAGISSNLLKYTKVVNDDNIKFRKSYIAIPFEVNFNLFKSEKRRFRVLYGLIPVGKPTAFGRSFGVKLFGSLGKFNYFGFGLNFGLGFHKNY
jgi:hypothetical protein